MKTMVKKKIRTLQEVMDKILADEVDDINHTLHIADEFEVQMDIYECVCGFYWTGNSVRVGVQVSEKKSEKTNVCYNCAQMVYKAREIIRDKIKVQSKPRDNPVAEALNTVQVEDEDPESPSQNELLKSAKLTLEEALYITETAKHNPEVILNNLPSREKEKPGRVDYIRTMLTGKDNLHNTVSRGWIKSSKQTYRIKQFRDILKRQGLLPNL